MTGGAALDHAFTNVTITILKKGHPNGLFRLIGTVRPNLVIAEPQSGATQIAIPVQREFGSTGPVTVSILFQFLSYLFQTIFIVRAKLPYDIMIRKLLA